MSSSPQPQHPLGIHSAPSSSQSQRTTRIDLPAAPYPPFINQPHNVTTTSAPSTLSMGANSTSSSRMTSFSSLKSSLSSSPHFSKMARHNSTNSAPVNSVTNSTTDQQQQQQQQQLLSASDHAMAAAVLAKKQQRQQHQFLQQQQQQQQQQLQQGSNQHSFKGSVGNSGGGRNKTFEHNDVSGNKWTHRYPAAAPAVQYPSAIQFITPSYNEYDDVDGTFRPVAMVASINCHVDAQEDRRLVVDTGVATPSPATNGIGSNSALLGPNLLVLHQLQRSPPFTSSSTTATSSGVFQPRPIAISRCNPNMGSGIYSTCLDVYRGDNSIGSPTIACATGLSTGTLCIHTFASTSSTTTAPSSPSATTRNWTCTKDYFTPRYQRPTSAVAWKPHDSRVAIGLLSSSLSALGSTPGAASNASSGSGASLVGGVVMGNSPNAVASSKHRGGVGGSVGGGSSGGGMANPREFGCFIWDIAHQPAVVATNSSGSTGAGLDPPTNSITSSGPLKLSQNVGVTSLAWVGDFLGPPLLAVGAQFRQWSLYDLRSPTNTSAPPITVTAYPQGGIHGILSDPMRPHILATFSKTAGEPVKLWDLRRIAEPTSSQLTSSGNASGNTTSTAWMEIKVSHQSMVSDIQWSSSNSKGATFLSVAMDGAIYEYDTWSGPRPALAGIYPTAGRVLSMAHHPSTSGFHAAEDVPSTKPRSLATSSGEAAADGIASHHLDDPNNNIPNKLNDSIPIDWMSQLYSHRLLVVVDDANRTIRDMAKHSNAPVAISPRDGRLAHALGHTLWIGPTSQGPSAMESFDPKPDDDISATMMRRARCLHVARYSMDTAANIQMLAEQMPEFTTSGGTTTSNESSVPSTRETLVRLWSWIERVEALAAESLSLSSSSADDLDSFVWPAKGLIDAGVWQLLATNEDNEYDDVLHSESLACRTYDSPARRAALTACGWAGKFSLDSVLSECEALGEFERSAALAVWHGNIGAAVDALQRGSDFVRENQLNEDDAVPYGTLQYAETLQLAAMCVAGYNANSDRQSSKASTVWSNACLSLLRRDDLSRPEVIATSRVAYLRGLCRFLMTIGANDALDEVLGDTHLSLSDRVAFACRFLELTELRSFLLRCIASCQNDGNAEGLIITGMDKQGIQLLQSYVDRYGDVQTAALVSSRVILPMGWSNERVVCLEWLEVYRGLLNTWQMWQSRAMFDVDRAEHLRRIKEESLATASTHIPHPQQAPSQPGSRMSNFHHSRRMVQPSKRQSSKLADPDVMPSLPAQLDARCNYCNVALGLKRQDGVQNQWLAKMKPILSCCPQCRKPLPRCSICLLSLGCLNPYTELTRERSRPARVGSGLPSPDNLSSLGNLPFAEWITWCMRCKHGGHAHHLVGWFANHETCPVSRCDCRCQFDGIQKLNRPALSPDNAHSTIDPE